MIFHIDPGTDMDLRRRCLPTVLVVIAAVLCSACGGDGLSISLTQDQLQGLIDRVFPVEGEREAVGVSLTDPAVTLAEGSDRIAFGLAISVSVVLEPGEGRLAEAADERAAEREATAAQAEQPGGRGARVKSRARAKVQDATTNARGRVTEEVEERTADRDPEVLSGNLTVSTAVRYESTTGELFLTDFRVEEMVVDQLPGRFNEPVTILASTLISNSLNQVPIYQIDDAGLGGSIARALLDEVVVRDGVLVIGVGLGN